VIQNNYFTDNEDIQLQFNELIDWDEVVREYEHDFSDHKKYQASGDEALAYAPASTADAVDYYRTIFESVGDISGTVVAACAADMDKEGLKYADGKVTFPGQMVECYEKAREAGIQPYSISRQHGGLGLPAIAQSMHMEMMARGDAAFSIAMGCVNLAETIERFADEDMIKAWVPQMASGDVCGAMALTEPNYGSDLPNVRTKAEQDENGVWRITGAKRFITHGCGFEKIPSVILTLARTGSPTSGAKGLSFFLVEGKDVFIAGVEKKLGLHCSPTCEVVYENAPAQLIGKEGFGLVKYAMGMMNAARQSISAQSMGIASAAYYEAKKYASEREQFGRLIQEIPAVRKMLNRMERETAAMRCMLYEAGRTIDLYAWRQHHLEKEGVNEREIRKDEGIRKWEKLANFMTPLTKYYTSEMCNTVAFDALQVHGGAGYTEDYDVARIYRDARITNIYEGTTQLQMHAAIGGVTAGMAATGPVRAYIDETLAKFTPSENLKKLRDLLETVIETYRNLKDTETRETQAFEAVETMARFINTMLLERSASRVKDPERRAHREQLARDYAIDSIALAHANLFKLQSAPVAEPALATAG
jgi:acyl-CoA dehydrogenase